MSYYHLTTDEGNVICGMLWQGYSDVEIAMQFWYHWSRIEQEHLRIDVRA